MNNSPAGQGHHTPDASQNGSISPAFTGTDSPQVHNPHYAAQAIPHPQHLAGPHPPCPPAGSSVPLLGLRSAIILTLGALAGVGASVLTYLAQNNAAAAILAGGATFGGAVLFFHAIIAT